MSNETPTPEVEFEGLDATECCFECGLDRCVITGADICGHPRKGGLQALQKANPEIVRRYNRARRYLGTQAAEQRNYGDE